MMVVSIQIIVFLIFTVNLAHGLGKSTFTDCGPPDRVFRFGDVIFPDTMFVSSVPNIVPYGKMELLEEINPNDHMGTTIFRNGKYIPCLPGGFGSCERPIIFWVLRFQKTFCHLFAQIGVPCPGKVNVGTYELKDYGLLLPHDIFPGVLRASKTLMSEFVNARYTVRTVVRDQNDYNRVKGCYIAEFDVRVAAN
ncbi:uncharacterized protein LOC141857301 [Brevipalpus obovatus]|uniref:uncharacterized protein LOC141857301 n=1 Tax=Brevipalpus obovatus TaxID=246614 RepID=UPI003D9F1A3B